MMEKMETPAHDEPSRIGWDTINNNIGKDIVKNGLDL